MKPGVPEIVAVRGDGPGVCVNTRSAGIPDWVIVRVFAASGSVAVAVIGDIAVPSAAVADAGAAMVGGVFVPPAGAPAPFQSNQSPGIPLAAPQGSAGSPTTYVFGKKNPSHSVPNAVPNPNGLMVEAPI